MIEQRKNYMQNYISKILQTIAFFAISLPFWVLPIKFSASLYYPVATVLIITLLALFCILKPNLIIKNIKKIFKYNAIKFLFLFTIFEIVIILIHAVADYNISFKPFLSIIYRFSAMILPLFFGFLLATSIKPIKTIRIIYFSIFFVLLFGIFDFVIFDFNIGFLQKIFNFFVNERLLVAEATSIKAIAGGIPRIQSSFTEPAYFAYFIVVHLPLIYNLALSKYKIFKNKFFNAAIKKTIIPLFWLNILGTQSPIFLIFSIIISIIYYIVYKKFSFKKLAKYAIIAGIPVVILIIICLNVDLSDTYFNRIKIVFDVITDFNLLVFAEPSLATRLICYINLFCLFLKHPFIGVGVGNVVKEYSLQITNASPVILTEEIVKRHVINENALNATILYSMLAELGIFGVILYLLFVVQLLKTTFKAAKYELGISKDFLIGCGYFLITFLFSLLYESHFNYFWLEFGMVLGYIHLIKIRRKYANINN